MHVETWTGLVAHTRRRILEFIVALWMIIYDCLDDQIFFYCRIYNFQWKIISKFYAYSCKSPIL